MSKIFRNILCVSLFAFAISGVYAANENASTMDIKTVINKVESAGYTNLTEVKKEKNHWEIECYNKQGEKMEIKMDMSEKIYKTERDDD
jgi:hypothetical protein